MHLWKVVLTSSLLSLAGTAHAATLFVSVSGSDANTGTLAAPLHTISRAALKAQPGDDVSVRGGIYNELVTISSVGSSASHVSFHPYPGEQPVIDGTGLGIDKNLVTFSQAAYVDFSGFEVRNATRIGICGWNASNIRVSGNNVHDAVKGGIYFGSDTLGNVSAITVDGNTVYHTVLENQYHTLNGGWSTALVVSWCNGASITNNKVYENSGEGIGFLLSNNGVVQQNVVFDNYSVEIYLDNASSLNVTQNLAYSTGNSTYFRGGFPAAGIGAANEPYTASNPLNNLTITDNIVINTRWGFYYGAYGNGGGLKNTTVANNTFYKSSTAVLWIENDAHVNSVVENNIFDQVGGLAMSDVAGTGVSYHNNSWYGGNAGTAAGTGDIIGDPRLANPGSFVAADYELTSSSPVLSKGVILPAVPTDFAGHARVTNDLGAFAYAATAPPADVQAPTAPTALTATIGSGSGSVSLVWVASRDNVGIAGYKVYRDLALVATIGPLTSWTDPTTLASGTHNYQVAAFDPAGNVSTASNIATVKIVKHRAAK